MTSEIIKVIGERVTAGSTLAYALLTLTLILAPRIAEKLRLPAMVGLVLAGMALGPHGTHALASSRIALQAAGNFGLLYLMFSAGLELDLKLFARMKKVALTFAGLSFIIPFSLGIVSARLLDYHWAAAILMGSNWGSHTLVTYPLLRQMGLSRNRAVATVVGATAVTDTTALLVLSGVSGTVQKTGSLALQGLTIALGLAVLVGWSLFLLPRLARWFFARVGNAASYRFVFGIAAFLVGAVLAEAGGIDGIVGAFFAGLGLNRAIPEDSPLMDRLQFTGTTLFIPIFLVSVGALLDPKVMIDPKTLGVAAVFTAAVLGGKSLAAVIAGRAFKFTWPEVGVMSGLSGSQAAATLATTLVGSKLGLFDTRTINAVLIVILASLVVTPALVSHFGRKVTGAKEAAPLGRTVLVPVWGESSRALLSLAGRLAAPDGGIVVAATLGTEESPEAELTARRDLRLKAEEWLARDGLESRSVFSVDRTIPAGLLHTIVGERATMLVAERLEHGDLEPESEALHALARAPVPVLVASGAEQPFRRILLMARAQDLAAEGRRELCLAAEMAARIGRHLELGLVAPSLELVSDVLASKKDVARIAAADPLAWLAEQARPGDVPFFAGIEAAREALRRIPELHHGTFLIAVAAHDPTTYAREEHLTGPVVVGRSLTPSPV